MARRCRSCLTVAEKYKRNCQACGKKLPKKAKGPAHRAALKEHRDVFVAANDGYDGCWVCRHLGLNMAGPMQRDHEHKGDGRPRGILCVYHNRKLGPAYTLELLAAYVAYLARPVYEPHTCCNCDRIITESESNWGWCPECVAADPDWMTKPGLARLKGAA